MKKICLAAAIVLTLALFAACSSRQYPTQEEIAAYVYENSGLLQDFTIEEVPTSQAEMPHFIREYLGSSTIVTDVYVREDGIILFYCGGSGLSTNSIYTGFYYSPEDEPDSVDFSGVPFREVAPDSYTWENEDSSHVINTKRALVKWFTFWEKYY